MKLADAQVESPHKQASLPTTTKAPLPKGNNTVLSCVLGNWVVILSRALWIAVVIGFTLFCYFAACQLYDTGHAIADGISYVATGASNVFSGVMSFVIVQQLYNALLAFGRLLPIMGTLYPAATPAAIMAASPLMVVPSPLDYSLFAGAIATLGSLLGCISGQQGGHHQ